MRRLPSNPPNPLPRETWWRSASQVSRFRREFKKQKQTEIVVLQLVAKILETFSLIEVQTVSQWSFVHSIPPPIFIGSAFLLGRPLFSLSVSTILQLVVAGAVRM